MLDKNVLDHLEDLYFRRGEDSESWVKTHAPEDDLIYKKGQPSQIKRIVGVSSVLDMENPIKFVGYHKSKSVYLPVTCFKFSPYDQVFAYCFVRDNFYDIKLCVICDGPVRMPYDLIHTEWSVSKYNDEKQKCLEYNLSTAKDDKEKEEIWSILERGGDQWYSTIWSSGTIIRHGERIYRAGSVSSVYCEGINSLGLPEAVFRPFKQGAMMFGCSIGTYGRLALILEHVERSLEKERYRRLDAPRCKKEPIPEDSDHITLEDFSNRCRSLCFIDYDGFGNYATETEMAVNKKVVPSDIINGNIDYNFSHVVWFNK